MPSQHISSGSILNVRGPMCDMIRMQNFKPRPLTSGTVSVKSSQFQGEHIFDSELMEGYVKLTSSLFFA